MDMDDKSGENIALIQYMHEHGGADEVDLGDGRLILSVPTGRKIESIKKYLDEYLTAPERAKGTAKLTTLDSFIAHVNRTKCVNSAIFADDTSATPGLLAVFDYNARGVGGNLGDPHFGEHRARYVFPLSDEWKAWTHLNGAKLDQATFAQVLEDRILDVIDPAKGKDNIKEFAVNLAIDLATPQRLMTLSRGLTVHVESKVAQHQNLTSGEGQIAFEQSHSDDNGAPLRVPGGFAIQIPAFRGGAHYHVPVRLRYRVAQGAITWTLSLHQTDVVMADAIEECAARAERETELPLFYGTPEVS